MFVYVNAFKQCLVEWHVYHHDGDSSCGRPWGNGVSEDGISHDAPNPQTFQLAFRYTSVGHLIPNIKQKNTFERKELVAH